MYAKRQFRKLWITTSDTKVNVRQKDLPGFAIPGGSNECCPLTSNFDAKNSRSEVECGFELPYFGPRPAVIKLIVQGGNTGK